MPRLFRPLIHFVSINMPYLFRASQPSSLSFSRSICRLTPRQSSSQNILENAFPIILFSGISSRIGRRIPHLPAGIELAETSLRMFLEEGLDPFRSVFDLPIPDSSAFPNPNRKTELDRTHRSFVCCRMTPKHLEHPYKKIRFDVLALLEALVDLLLFLRVAGRLKSWSTPLSKRSTGGI